METLYERAVELQPNDVNALCNLGCFQASRHGEQDTNSGAGRADSAEADGKAGGEDAGERARERTEEGCQGEDRGNGSKTAASSASYPPHSPPPPAGAPQSSAAQPPGARSLAAAHETFRRALALVPYHACASANMGMILSSSRPQEAQALVSDALQHHPDDDDLLEAAQWLLRGRSDDD